MSVREKITQDFKLFIEAMIDELERHHPDKGDSWKTTSPNYFYKLFHDILDLYEITKNPDELVDMANILAMWWMTTPRYQFSSIDTSERRTPE